MTTIKINKEKNIGKVLLIVEGLKTEFYLIHKLFTQIFDYQYESLNRMLKYKKSNSKEGIESSVFVINTEESAISFIDDSNDFLNNMFEKLIEDYDFPVDRSAIFYIFDRDADSNKDSELITNLIKTLSNSRENEGFTRQGMLLISYPCIESFVASGFIENTHDLEFKTGSELKRFLNEQKIYKLLSLLCIMLLDLGLIQITE
ncbi:hypothetical protein HPL003_11410 [Paenibacillus terrae HPL-003]|uniref:Uncharacterized protein n=1 Tax=Paenibacillus terrae (strain HPL-003) TaxID=985665 RepID=G7VYP9_PAETH|nr:hypothetical protein [Paenibacillus terrae]AET59039.1 hypothetical protein HPL003_11410 [Paenibacillus terrae HPL-003]